MGFDRVMKNFKSPMNAWVIGMILSMALAGNLDLTSASRLPSTSSIITLASDQKSSQLASQARNVKEGIISKLSTSGAVDFASEDTQARGFFTGIHSTSLEPLKAIVHGGWKVTNQVGETINAHCTDTQKVDMNQPQFMPGNYITRDFSVPHQSLVWYCNFFWNTVPVDKDGSIVVWAFDGKSYLHSCDNNCEWEVRKDGFFLKHWPDGQFYRQAGWRVHHPV